MTKLINKLLAVLTISSFITIPVFAQQLVVTEGHVRASIPGTNVSSAYMTLKNNSDSVVTLIGATSDVSDRIEIHEHVMTESMMSMRKRDQLIVDAHSQVQLQPYGYHLMIFNLAKPLIAEKKAKITLQFSQGDPQTIELPIQGIKQGKGIKQSNTKSSQDSHKHH